MYFSLRCVNCRSKIQQVRIRIPLQRYCVISALTFWTLVVSTTLKFLCWKEPRTKLLVGVFVQYFLHVTYTIFPLAYSVKHQWKIEVERIPIGEVTEIELSCDLIHENSQIQDTYHFQVTP